eukprot:1149241-Prymnesium_polylepis.1
MQAATPMKTIADLRSSSVTVTAAMLMVPRAAMELDKVQVAGGAALSSVMMTLNPTAKLSMHHCDVGTAGILWEMPSDRGARNMPDMIYLRVLGMVNEAHASTCWAYGERGARVPITL